MDEFLKFIDQLEINYLIILDCCYAVSIIKG